MVRSSEDGRHGTGHPRTALPAEEGMPETTVMPASGAASSADAPSQRTLLLDETAHEHATGLVIRKKKTRTPPAHSRRRGILPLFRKKVESGTAAVRKRPGATRRAEEKNVPR